jgi:hypothetical protein
MNQRQHMTETLLEYQTPVVGPGSAVYVARACGSPGAGVWQGWIEFTPVDGGPTVRSGRETTQPNRENTVYWATGLTPVYLEGALNRALDVLVPSRPILPSHVPSDAEGRGHAVLNPFSVYEKGEAFLRRQLGALSGWHLLNIIRDYELDSRRLAAFAGRTRASLIDTIVAAVAASASSRPGRAR